MVKIEIILIFLIISIITMGMTVELNSKNNTSQKLNKEIDFDNTTIDEVNTKTFLDRTYTTYGVRNKGILRMKNIKYHSSSVESLISKEGKYVNDILYLHKDVIMSNDGYIYTTQKLNYNKKTQILNITSPFKATNNINTFWGKSLTYYTLTKESYAKKTRGIFYTKKSTQ